MLHSGLFVLVMVFESMWQDSKLIFDTTPNLECSALNVKEPVGYLNYQIEESVLNG